MLPYVIFAALLVLWCTLHSVLATDCCKGRIGRLFDLHGRHYRLFYNLFSLATLLPLLFWGWTLPGPVLLTWDGTGRLLRTLLWLVAAVFIVGGCRRYDLTGFAGLTDPAGEGDGSDKLVTSGILGIVRHPWYTAAFIVLWARDLDLPALLVSAVFSLYLVIGARLEERRLVEEFGEAYRRYRSQVPMFIPWKWPLHLIRRGR
ncbi:MAG: isoprenylcysteine carboxylmethyltransferase family protein [Desulfuromonadales bacterium]|nr:isoprenylcysteine carboxylmethyltransferase family protein [Desulfuromonadales bacterium]NIR34054.1 isoprenylcysteine carboxylmethyltransferase family protein [Desulfuromonadales bacterium]NIS44105.1 isoprenylcysteine carboxylmethyltransferase family protein [Desulfuromonadales bacterium]